MYKKLSFTFRMHACFCLHIQECEFSVLRVLRRINLSYFGLDITSSITRLVLFIINYSANHKKRSLRNHSKQWRSLFKIWNMLAICTKLLLFYFSVHFGSLRTTPKTTLLLANTWIINKQYGPTELVLYCNSSNIDHFIEPSIHGHWPVCQTMPNKTGNMTNCTN